MAPLGVFMENSRHLQAPQIWWGSSSEQYHLLGGQQLKFQLSSFSSLAGFIGWDYWTLYACIFHELTIYLREAKFRYGNPHSVALFCHDIPDQFSAVLTILSIILQDLKSIRLWLTPEFQSCSDTCVQWWAPYTCAVHPVWLPSTNAQSPFEFWLVSVVVQSLQIVIDFLQSI